MPAEPVKLKWEWHDDDVATTTFVAQGQEFVCKVEYDSGATSPWYWQTRRRRLGDTSGADSVLTGRAESVGTAQRHVAITIATTLADPLSKFVTVAAPKPLVTEQPAPQESKHPAVWPLVFHDMLDRHAEGERKYGKPLQPHNGRDALVDAYQEALDLCVYLRQAIYERDGK